jgi:hypothetical protein
LECTYYKYNSTKRKEKQRKLVPALFDWL